MNYNAAWPCPVLGSHLMSDYSRIHEDIQGIQGLLGSWLHAQKAKKRTRDRLASELEELQDRVEESLFARENKNTLPDPEHMSLEEKLIVFLNWRDELQILHSSIGRSLALAKRMRSNKRREDVRELQEVYDDLTDYLCETDMLHQRAQDKFEAIQNCNEPPQRWRDEPSRTLGTSQENTANLDWQGYPRTRKSGSTRREATGEERFSSEEGLEDRYARRPPVTRRRSLDVARGKRFLQEIVNDAEKIRQGSTEASLRMENEVERLKAKSIDMAKDLVALNRVIEHQKEQLIELTRMKKENLRAERELELGHY